MQRKHGTILAFPITVNVPETVTINRATIVSKAASDDGGSQAAITVFFLGDGLVKFAQRHVRPRRTGWIVQRGTSNLQRLPDQLLGRKSKRHPGSNAVGPVPLSVRLSQELTRLSFD